MGKTGQSGADIGPPPRLNRTSVEPCSWAGRSSNSYYIRYFPPGDIVCASILWGHKGGKVVAAAILAAAGSLTNPSGWAPMRAGTPDRAPYLKGARPDRRASGAMGASDEPAFLIRVLKAPGSLGSRRPIHAGDIAAFFVLREVHSSPVVLWRQLYHIQHLLNGGTRGGRDIHQR